MLLNIVIQSILTLFWQLKKPSQPTVANKTKHPQYNFAYTPSRLKEFSNVLFNA